MIEDLVALVNKHDAEGMISFYTEDVEYVDVAMPANSTIGSANYKNLFYDYFSTFPDLHNELEQIICSEDGLWATAVYTLTGSHEENGDDEYSERKSFSIKTVSIFERQGDRFKSETQYWDKLSLYRQLGWNLE